MGIGVPRAQRPATPLRFRRSAAMLTAGQLATLRDAFVRSQAIGDDRGYGFWSGIHGLPLPIGCDNAHGTPFFLPWHRAYLYFFERSLRDRNPDAMLTWWDWRVPPGGRPSLPAIFTDPGSASGANPLLSAPVDPIARRQGRALAGQLRIPASIVNATRTFRRPGQIPAPMPTVEQVEQLLEVRDFLDFSSALEGFHDNVHVWTGGHMSQVPFAAFDPVFWAHHTMIDRIWRVWQLRHPGALPPAQLLDQALPPFRMTVRQTLDVTALGYDYAVSTSSAPRRSR
jgi:tyrosinase